jgi:hypothetical protein
MDQVTQRPALFAALAGVMLAGAAPCSAQPAGKDLIFVPPVEEDAPTASESGAQCIALHRVQSTRIIAGEGIVYQLSGRRMLINRPRHGLRQLERNQVLVIHSRGAMLCAGDIVHLADGLPGVTSAVIALGRFEVYGMQASN